MNGERRSRALRSAARNDCSDGSSARGRPAPAIVIRFELEARPTVIAAWNTDADDARMTEWLDAHPEYAELLHRAVELSGAAA